MTRFTRWYGAGPLHLLALIASFALSGYLAQRLLVGRSAAIAIWFAGAAIGHDLLLLPLYAIADRGAQAVLRHAAPTWSAGRVNYVRVPALLSGLLFVMFFPLILRQSAAYVGATGFPLTPYLGRWLAITGALFLSSAVLLALRLRRPSPGAPRPSGSPPATRL